MNTNMTTKETQPPGETQQSKPKLASAAIALGLIGILSSPIAACNGALIAENSRKAVSYILTHDLRLPAVALGFFPCVCLPLGLLSAVAGLVCALLATKASGANRNTKVGLTLSVVAILAYVILGLVGVVLGRL